MKKRQSMMIALAACSAMALQSTASWAAQEAGDRAFTLSGTGTSDEEFDNNAFGASGELGWFFTNQVELGVRQSVNVLSLENQDDSWSGSTRGFIDYHFGQGTWVPYLGANIGGIYGENVNDTGTAGVEAGLKVYVKPKTYIALQTEYQFLFEDADQIDNQFDDGAFFYTLGIGFNF